MAADPQTYAGLQASILRWMQDNTLAPVVPEMIALAERRLSRLLNTPEMEASITLTVTNGQATLPADLMQIRALYLTKDNYRVPINELTQADFDRGFSSDNTGTPLAYSISGQTLSLRPYPDDTYTLSLTYKRALPPLSDTASTNWLLTQASDLYLYSSILASELYGWNDARLPLLSGLVEGIIAEVNKAGRDKRYGVGPLVPRPPVSDASFYRGYR